MDFRALVAKHLGKFALVFISFHLYSYYETAKNMVGDLPGIVLRWREATHWPWDRLASLFGATLPDVLKDGLNFLILFFVIATFTFYELLQDTAELQKLRAGGKGKETLDFHEWDLPFLSAGIAGAGLLIIVMRSFLSDWTMIGGVLVGMVGSALAILVTSSINRAGLLYLKKLANNLWMVLILFAAIGLVGSKSTQEFFTRILAIS